jgi:hypothetical protein
VNISHYDLLHNPDQCRICVFYVAVQFPVFGLDVLILISLDVTTFLSHSIGSAKHTIFSRFLCHFSKLPM